MPKIKKITLKDFKFFYGKEEIILNRDNLLLYGENGSGKSSIYWALYTFLQSVFKDDNEDIKKYFDRTKPENLVNRFSDDTEESLIMVEFENENQSTFTRQISLNTINTKDGNEIKEAVRASDFVNYKLLSKMYDFSNSQYIDLFPVLAQEVLMFINFRRNFTKRDGSAGSVNAADWWQYIMAGMNPHPKMHEQDYKDFIAVVNSFNSELEFFLNKLLQTANEYLNDHFELPIRLYLNYRNCTFNDFRPNTKSRSWKTKPPKVVITTEFIHDKLPHPKRAVQKPHTFLNEAKLSAIALSLRLAVLEEKYQESAPKILVIDDMLISLDMSNRNIVLDIILQNFPKYQILFMTHDRMLFEITKQKIKQLGQDNWRFVEMYESEENNIPKPFFVLSESYFEKAKRYFHLKEYEIAGNFLRKATESFCKDFLPKRMHFNEDANLLDLNGLILKCIEYTNDLGIDNSILTELSSHRRFVFNPTSHDSYDVPKFNSEVGKCLKTVEKIQNIKHDIILKKGTELVFELSDGTNNYSFDIIVHDDMKLIKIDSLDSFLSKGRFTYKVLRNGTEIAEDSKKIIQTLYKSKYDQSDKVKSVNFWDEIIIKSSGDKLSSIKIY